MSMLNPFSVLDRVAIKQAELTDIEQLGLRRAGYIGMAGLGAGAAARGIKGLYNLLQRSLNPPKPSYPQAIVTSVPVPVREDDDEHEKRATTPEQLPWYYGLAATAGGLGAIGGWKGVDAILESQRESQQENSQEKARKDFEAALLYSFDRPRQLRPGLKTAGDELGEALDKLYDRVMAKQAGANVVKTAGLFGTGAANDTANQGLGLYSLYALMTGVPVGMWAYHNAESGSRRAVLEKAMKQRNRTAYSRRPSEIYAVPKPVTRIEPEEQDPEELIA